MNKWFKFKTGDQQGRLEDTSYSHINISDISYISELRNTGYDVCFDIEFKHGGKLTLTGTGLYRAIMAAIYNNE